MFGTDHAPLFVNVTPTRWDSYGTPTVRSKLLFKLLKSTGGISDSVTPGWYDFNVVRRGLKLIMTLAPHKE